MQTLRLPHLLLPEATWALPPRHPITSGQAPGLRGWTKFRSAKLSPTPVSISWGNLRAWRAVGCREPRKQSCGGLGCSRRPSHPGGDRKTSCDVCLLQLLSCLRPSGWPGTVLPVPRPPPEGGRGWRSNKNPSSFQLLLSPQNSAQERPPSWGLFLNPFSCLGLNCEPLTFFLLSSFTPKSMNKPPWLRC